MKKIIITIVCTVLGYSAFAQKKISEYHSDFYDRNYYVEIGAPDEEGIRRFYVEVNTDDQNIDEVNISIFQSTLKEFISVLEAAKAKYNEWSEVAEKHNVTYVEKKMALYFPSIKAGLDYGDSWEFDYNDIKPVFKVNDGKTMLILKGSPIVTEYYTCSNYDITFSSAAEIDEFIECFDDSVIEKYNGWESKVAMLAPKTSENETTRYSDFTTYHSDYFGKDFFVKISPEKNSDFTYRIETASADRYMDTVTISIKSSEIKQLRDAIKKSADYYNRWCGIATENKVDDIDKAIDVQFPKCTGSFNYNSSWFNDENETTLTPRFRIMDNKMLLILTGSEIVTDYVDCDGFYIVFESQGEIDNFIKCFDQALLESHLKETNSQELLFR